MLHTVVDCYAIFYDEMKINKDQPRSTNPYSYIRSGYFLEDGALFGGHNNVNFNIHSPSYCPSNMLDIANK